VLFDIRVKIAFAFLTIVYVLIILFYTISVHKGESQYLQRYTESKSKQYEMVYNSFRKLAINTFFGILDQEKITEIFKKTQDENVDQDKLRKELYVAFKGQYRKMRMLGIRYVNFFLPNNQSFLRMDSRSKFGDDLSGYRDSIVYVNENRMAFESLEQGGSTPAFRFVYPSFDHHNNYLGAIEVSFKIDEMLHEFEKSFGTRARMIFTESLFKTKSYVNNQYKRSMEHQSYLVKNEVDNVAFNQLHFISEDDFLQIREDVQREIRKNAPFSLHFYAAEQSKVVSFLPKFNSENQNIAYFVSYDDDNYLQSLEEAYNLVVTIVTFIFLLLAYIIYIMLKNKDILEKKVREKTNEIQKLYRHEKYLKDLLQTIAEVNQGLITTFSISSIIESALEKLHEHSNYKLITYAYVNRDEMHLRYVKGDIYSLIAYEVIDINEAENGHILQSAIDAIKTNKTSIDTSLVNIPSDEIKHTRESDYNLESSISILLKEDDVTTGVITLFNTSKEFENEEIALLENVVYDVSNAISVSKQRQIVSKLQEEQISNYEETVLAFVDMIEHRDAYTAGHTIRVAKYCRVIAEEFDVPQEDIIKLEKAAILHDIGKIATPDTILLKPGRLSELEYSLIQEHAQVGYDMLSKVGIYKELAELIIFHHERFDGTGYPRRMKGNEIPFLAHILIVSDAFDAMTTNRIYKSRLTNAQACDELVKYAGRQFHPKVAEVASRVLREVQIEHTSQVPTTMLEKERFAYFFSDSLTSVHNEEYLHLTLKSNMNAYEVTKINLSNMNTHNKEFGWESGNKLLQDVASYLQSTYKDAMVFRYHGDDFVLLSEKKMLIDETSLHALFENTEANVSVEYYDPRTRLEDFIKL